MKDKVLVTIVTRDNFGLLEHLCQSLEQRSAGYEHDVLVLDGESSNQKQLKLLDKLSKKYKVQTVPNNRVEANYNIAWKENKDYKYYFFMHDDSRVIQEDWLKAFIDRMHSGYSEDIIKNTHLSKLPIGRVCVGTQFWRDYETVLGYPVQCLFLKHVQDVIRPGKTPKIFKYCDGDRVLISHECISATDGFRHVEDFKALQQQDSETYSKLCEVLNKYLPYRDEGTYPKDKYPPGECWGKFCLTGEFMSSTDPLIEGYRSVGLKDDGYLEQLHGFATPMQHDHITHYGSPNFREFIGKALKSNREDIKKHFNNKVFIMKMDKIYKEWLSEQSV